MIEGLAVGLSAAHTVAMLTLSHYKIDGLPAEPMKWLRGMVVVSASCFTGASLAGPVIEMSMKGQPLQYTKDGRIDGCGVGIVGTTTIDPQIKRVQVIDVSFNVAFPIVGIIKGGMLEATYAAVMAGNISSATKVRISNIWMKAPNGKPTRPVTGKPIQAESDKSNLMYATGASSMLPLVEAVREGHPIQVGFHIPADGLDRVFFGRVEMTQGESAQFADCMQQWLAATKTFLEAKPR